MGTMFRSLHFDLHTQTLEPSLPARTERPTGPISRVVGLYQTLLRQTLERFFPDAVLDNQGDRSVIDWEGSSRDGYYRIIDDPDGLSLDIEWLGTRLTFRPESPVPLLALDLRFRGLFDQDAADRLERFQYVTEDLIIADFLRPIGRYRVPAALEALRVAALSTYENRRVSTGALLLGTAHDPADPDRKNP